MFKGLKGLKATNEWQDDGTGILHQVAQFPIDQVYRGSHLYTGLSSSKRRVNRDLGQ